MYHPRMGVLIVLGFFVFEAWAVFVLLFPSRSIEILRNPWLSNTPWTRLQIRAVGLVFFFFAAVGISMAIARVTNSARLSGFSDFLLADLWLSFASLWILGLSSWIAWRFTSVRRYVRRHFPPESLEDPAWERRMTAIFCSALALMLAVAFFLAVSGHNANTFSQPLQ